MVSELSRRVLARLSASAIPGWHHSRTSRFFLALAALAFVTALGSVAHTWAQLWTVPPRSEIAVANTPTATINPSPTDTAGPNPIETVLPTETATPAAAIPIPVAAAAKTALVPTFAPSPIPFYPTLTPKPRPSITPTATPHDFTIEELTSEEARMMQDGLFLLRNCAVPMYDYVRSHVNTVTRGTKTGMTAYVYTGVPIVYLPESGTINDPKRYRDSLRTFVAAIVLAHESRHIEMGKETTEPDAYAFTLPLLEPCKPNDIGDETTQWDWRKGYDPYLAYKQFRQYQEWRATLPYPGEPPASVRPPAVR